MCVITTCQTTVEKAENETFIVIRFSYFQPLSTSPNCAWTNYDHLLSRVVVHQRATLSQEKSPKKHNSRLGFFLPAILFSQKQVSGMRGGGL